MHKSNTKLITPPAPARSPRQPWTWPHADSLTAPILDRLADLELQHGHHGAAERCLPALPKCGGGAVNAVPTNGRISGNAGISDAIGVDENEADPAEEVVFYTEESFGPPPPFSATECILEYADVVLLDLLDWTAWHRDRAALRGLPKQWGLDAVEIAACLLFEGMRYGWDDDVLHDTGNRLHRAVTSAKEEAERACRVQDCGASRRLQNRDEHAEEMETSYLRSYAHLLCGMSWHFQRARGNPASGMEECHEAARSLVFHYPRKVEHLACTA